MSLPKWEEVREIDSSTAIGLHIKGHDLTDDEAVAYAWGLILLEEIGWDWDGECHVTFQPPRRVWVRTIPIPIDGGSYFEWRYQTFPQRGASPVILIDFTSGWAYRCDLPGCENHYVRGGARSGIPVEQFIDPPTDRQDERYVYMCRRHAASFTERREAAIKARMAEWYAERAS